MLVKSAQNWSISSEICPENSHEMGRFFLIAFSVKLAPKNFRKTVSENPPKFDFHDLSDLIVWKYRGQKSVEIWR